MTYFHILNFRFERLLGPCVDILKRNIGLYHSFISLDRKISYWYHITDKLSVLTEDQISDLYQFRIWQKSGPKFSICLLSFFCILHWLHKSAQAVIKEMLFNSHVLEAINFFNDSKFSHFWMQHVIWAWAQRTKYIWEYLSKYLSNLEVWENWNITMICTISFCWPGSSIPTLGSEWVPHKKWL